MSIGSAVQRGNMVFIYDERGHQTGMVAAGYGPHDGLRGYTGSSVSVQRGRMVFIYDEKGHQTGMAPVR